MSTSKLIVTLVAFASIVLMAFSPVSESKTYKADIKNSSLTWVGEKVTGKHSGNISLKSGQFDFIDGKLAGGNFVLDMTSITVTDLEGEWAGKLLGHLKSDDFFGVEKFETASFKATSVKPHDDGTFHVTGDLTIKGITHETTFPVTVEEKDGKMHTMGTATIDRTKYGIRYGSGSFFDDLGDKTISDNFDLSFNIVSK